MNTEELEKMSNDTRYEKLFKHEVARFVEMRMELNNAKTKVKKAYLEKKIAKQKSHTLDVGMKLAMFKELQESATESLESTEETTE